MFCFVLSIHLNVFSNQVYTSVSIYPPNLIYLLGLDRQMYKFVRSSVQSWTRCLSISNDDILISFFYCSFVYINIEDNCYHQMRFIC